MKEINDRITPIYMGSTGWRLSIRLYQQDHPHIHGEHCSSKDLYGCLKGSPPYTWGALTSSVSVVMPIKDHPHIHGEHPLDGFKRGDDQGSPPYTWGALLKSSTVKFSFGITPIYMESTPVTRP